VEADTGQLRAIRDQVAGQRADMDRLASVLVELIQLTSPVLLDAAARGRDHNTRTAAIHSGRHRRDRLPPRCAS
jgi:hypothetical protein